MLAGTVSVGGRFAAARPTAAASTSRGVAAPARASLLRPSLASPLTSRRAAPAPRKGRGGLACKAMFERFTEVRG